MKSKSRPFFRSASLAAVGCICITLSARADDGAWSNPAGGDWNLATTDNWQLGIVADGVDFYAYFDLVDITADTTVVLTEDRTISNLYFNDTDPDTTAAGWILNGAGKLTLDSTFTPEIRVDNFASGKYVTIANEIAGPKGFTKTGTGMLALSGASSYAGVANLNAGTLALSGGGNRLPVTGTVNFSGAATLDLGSTSQTLANLTVTPGQSATITGAGGSLLLGGNDFLFGDQSVAGTSTLDMSGLGTFTFNGATKAFQVNSGLFTSTTTAYDSTLKLANASTLTANSFIIGGGGTANSSNISKDEVDMGQTTTINANEIRVGYLRNQGTLKFLAGLTNPSLMLRGTDGSARVGILNVGEINGGGTTTVRNSLIDTTTGTLDALVDTMILAYNIRTGSSTVANTASFLMGSGTLDANSITLAKDITGSSTSGGGARNIIGNLTVAGGTVKIGTLTLADRLVNTMTATFTLNSGGTLAAQLIKPGNSTATRTFNWNDGTIKNYDASTDLTINTGLTTFNLAGTGLHAFDISTGRTGTVSQILSGTGALTKLGTGTLTLAVANTFTGNTAVNAGTLLLTGSLAGPTSFGTTGTMAGNGTVTGAATIATTGILSPGDNDVASLHFGSSLTLDSGSTYAATITSATTNDKVLVTGEMTANGTIKVKLSGYTPVLNDSFDLADDADGAIAGTPAFDFSEAVLGSGLAWDTSSFATNGTIKVIASVSDTYATWAAGKGLTGDAALPGADPDGDGIPNSVEMVLGGHPGTGMDSSLLPTLKLVTDPVDSPAVPSGNYLLFTYRRTDQSVAASVASACETSTNLTAPWTKAEDGVAGVLIRATDNATFTPAATTPTDEVRVYVPRGSQTRLFGRLDVTVP